MRLSPTLRRLLIGSVILLVVVSVGGPQHVARAAPKEIKEHLDRIRDNARDSFKQRERESAIRAIAKIGGGDAAAALVPLFDDPYVHLRDHVVSAWITMLKGNMAAEAQTWLSGAALRNRNPEVRAGAITALSINGGAELVESLTNVIKSEKDALVLSAMGQAGLRMGDRAPIPGVFPKKLTHKDGWAVFYAAQCAAKFDGAEAAAALRKALKHRHPLGRAGAVLGLQSIDQLPAKAVDAVLADKSHEPPIALAESLPLRTKALPWPGPGLEAWKQLLEHHSWRVRAAAIQAGLHVWENDIFEPLAQRMEQESGRLANDAHRALMTYTGQLITNDADLWRKWWIVNKAEFDPGERPKPNRGGRIEREGSQDAVIEGSVAFFKLPLRSRRIAFVFDLSGSMRNPIDGVDGHMTKLELLNRAFAKTLAALPPETHFDVLVYRFPSSYPPKPVLTRALKKLQPCSPGSRRRAIDWVARQEAKGWGAFMEPLEAAFQEDVDTVIWLSDGRPSRGRFDRDFRILQELPKANRFRQVAVNTVLIGKKGADRKFMEALAAQTGGRFAEGELSADDVPKK